MLLSAAMLDIQLYLAKPTGYALGLQVMTYSYDDPVAFEASFQAYVATWKDEIAPLLQVIVDDFIWNEGTNLAELRANEKQVSYYISPTTDAVSIAVHDLRSYTKLGAVLGIITTFCICIVLATGSLLLSKVTQDLVLSPIEDMISKVKEITADPIKAAQQAEEEAVKKEEHEL